MKEDTAKRDADAPRAAALKARLAGALTASVVVGLALAPDALARLAVNHNETVLTLD